MSLAAYYEVRLYSPVGAFQKALDQWNGLTISKGLNAPGSLTLSLPTGIIENYITPDMRLEVWRSVNGGALGLLLNQTWLTRKADIKFNSNTYTTTITALSALDLLSGRMIAANDGTSQATKTDTADDLIKQFCREQIGATAASDRNLSTYLTIETDQNAAPSTTKAAAWRPLLQTCQELAQTSAQAGTRLYFDIVGAASSGGLALRTWINTAGIDRRFPSGFNPLILSPEAGNLDDAVWGRDYTQQVTYMYAGAKGQGSDRIIGTASDAVGIGQSPFGRREQLVSSQAETQAGADADAQAALRSKRLRATLQGTIVQNDQTIFGVHWGLGDLVTASILGNAFDCAVEAISIGIQNGEETISGTLRSL